MPRNYRREAEQEDSQRKLQRAWIQERVEAIRAAVSAFDVLRRHGVNLQQKNDNRIEQFSCPFHGKDNKPSARIYPSSPGGPSHAWCFVCQERWDAIQLWRKFNDPTVPFTRSLAEIERAYGLRAPEMPNVIDLRESVREQELEELRRLLEIAERRLVGAREDFDMKGYLTVGSVLDKIHTRLEKGAITPVAFRGTIHKILEKIGERCRAAS
jgi:hypothetical protein